MQLYLGLFSPSLALLFLWKVLYLLFLTSSLIVHSSMLHLLLSSHYSASLFSFTWSSYFIVL
ncbi:hypothetical protein B0H19DRAFT_1182815 [Mycena capillaripes]|nr:hypothetical protein B0H19DRAFT_1182815 [Mycena capillaripes]